MGTWKYPVKHGLIVKIPGDIEVKIGKEGER